MGVNHSTIGTATVNAICNLALLTGQIGRAGAAPFSITGQCNAMGTREAGFTSSMPGYRKFDNPADRAELAALWGIDESAAARQARPAYPDIVEAAVAKKIRALWIIATNPLVSYPNQDVLRHGLSNLDFLVVQDGYHPTPTTELADLVLPAAIWGEKEGTYTNSERRVSKVNKAVEPPGEARSDFDIFLAVAEKLGCRDELFPGWTDARRRFQRMAPRFAADACATTPASATSCSREQGAVQWPLPEGATAERHVASLRRRQFPDRRRPREADLRGLGAVPGTAGRRVSVRPEHRPHGGALAHAHQDARGADSGTPSPRAWLEMNPRDAQAAGSAQPRFGGRGLAARPRRAASNCG